MRIGARSLNQLKAMFANMAARGLLKGVQRRTVQQLRNINPSDFARKVLEEAASPPKLPKNLGSPEIMEKMIEGLRGRPTTIMQDNMIAAYRSWQDQVKRADLLEDTMLVLRGAGGGDVALGATEAQIRQLGQAARRRKVRLSEVSQEVADAFTGGAKLFQHRSGKKALARLAYGAKSGVRGHAFVYEDLPRDVQVRGTLMEHAPLVEDLARRAGFTKVSKALTARVLGLSPKQIAQTELREYVARKLHGGIGYIPRVPGGSTLLERTGQAPPVSIEPQLERSIGHVLKIAAVRGSRRIHQYQRPLAEKVRSILFGKPGGARGGLITPIETYLNTMTWDTSLRKYVRRRVRRAALPGMMERSREYARAREASRR